MGEISINRHVANVLGVGAVNNWSGSPLAALTLINKTAVGGVEFHAVCTMSETGGEEWSANFATDGACAADDFPMAVARAFLKYHWKRREEFKHLYEAMKRGAL